MSPSSDTMALGGTMGFEPPSAPVYKNEYIVGTEGKTQKTVPGNALRENTREVKLSN